MEGSQLNEAEDAWLQCMTKHFETRQAIVMVKGAVVRASSCRACHEAIGTGNCKRALVAEFKSTVLHPQLSGHHGDFTNPIRRYGEAV